MMIPGRAASLLEKYGVINNPNSNFNPDPYPNPNPNLGLNPMP